MPRPRITRIQKKPIILISMGDFNGIGPEISLAAVLHAGVRRICIPILVGSTDVYESYAKRFRRPVLLKEIVSAPASNSVDRVPIIPIYNDRTPSVHPGAQATEAGRFAGEAVRKCVALCLSGFADGFVTSPTSKDVMNRAGFGFPGQTEMVAELAGNAKPTMMLIAGTFRVALATVHVPLKLVPLRITRELILTRLSSMHKTMQSDFRISHPKIAVLGLNPHAGENGLLGSEEKKVIGPAITLARRRKINANGPFPADGFFGKHYHKNYDAVLAMYHDQGLIPLKMSGFNQGVNFSSGLRVVRTSPDHGTAFEIAGKGIADPGSMIEAVKLAASIISNRSYDHS